MSKECECDRKNGKVCSYCQSKQIKERNYKQDIRAKFSKRKKEVEADKKKYGLID